MEKKKVSAFEFAIAQSISEKNNNPALIENIEPYTSEEEYQQRVDKVKSRAEQFRVKTEWKPMNSAPKDGTTIVANYGTIEKPETALICWSHRPVCMLGSTNGGFPPGWATAPESDTDTNLPMDQPNYWTEYYN